MQDSHTLHFKQLLHQLFGGQFSTASPKPSPGQGDVNEYLRFGSLHFGCDGTEDPESDSDPSSVSELLSLAESLYLSFFELTSL